MHSYFTIVYFYGIKMSHGFQMKDFEISIYKSQLSELWFLISPHTAMRILEILGIQTSSLFVKIWYVCIRESKAKFLYFWLLYGLVFDLETIEVSYVETMIWWLIFEKMPFLFWREIWIQVIVILLQLYFAAELSVVWKNITLWENWSWTKKQMSK